MAARRIDSARPRHLAPGGRCPSATVTPPNLLAKKRRFPAPAGRVRAGMLTPVTKIDKTHAMRVLDANGVAYRVTAYDPAGAFHAAEDAAALLGAPADAVYKTLVVLRDGATSAKPLMVMVPAAAQIDLRLLAPAVGVKKLRMATLREAERLTGMRAGGISAVGLRRPTFEILIDDHARALESVHVSAGVRGTDIEIAVEDLLRLTGARFVRAVA